MSHESKTPGNLEPLWQKEAEDYVCGLAWGAADGALAVAAANGALAIFDGLNGVETHRLGRHKQGINAIAWRPDGRLLASGGQDGLVKFWSLAAGKAGELAVPAGAAWVEHLQWNRPESADPTYPRLASAAGKKLKLWNYQGEMVREFPDHPATIAGLGWQPGRQMIAAATHGGVALWGASDGKLHQTLEYRQSPVLQISWSPNGQWLVAATQEGGVHVWQVKKKQEMQMSGFESRARGFSWDSSGRFLATDGGSAVSLWDFSGDGPAGRAPQRLEWHRAKISAVAFAHEGAVVASGAEDGSVAVWRLDEADRPSAIVKLEEAISGLAWSPDDGLLAVGGARGGLGVYRGK